MVSILRENGGAVETPRHCPSAAGLQVPGGGAGGRDEGFRRSPGSLSGVSGQALGASQDCWDGEQRVDGETLGSGMTSPDVSSLLSVITDLLQGLDWVRMGQAGQSVGWGMGRATQVQCLDH